VRSRVPQVNGSESRSVIACDFARFLAGRSTSLPWPRGHVLITLRLLLVFSPPPDKIAANSGSTDSTSADIAIEP
jgi:hypothetical protein